MTRELATSPDAQWVAARDGRAVTLIGPRTRVSDDAPASATIRFELESDDSELAFVHGPPPVLLAIARTADATRVSLYIPPEVEPAARLELGARAHIAAVGSGRVALVTEDRKEMTMVRAAGRGLAPHPIDLGDGSVDFAVAIDRNQLVIGQPRKLEMWDAVSGRPLRRLGLELPPAPRLVGGASGHLWVVRPGTDEVVMFRLSDGRPFRHYVGSPIDDAIASPGSPVIVLVTRRGLVRLHCFAHSLFAIESPWRTGDPMAQLVAGEDVRLLGWPAGASEPWEVAIGGTGPATEPIAQETTSTLNAAEKLKAMRGAGVQLAMSNPGEVTTFVAAGATVPGTTMQTAQAQAQAHAQTPTPTPTAETWRDRLATFATSLLRGHEVAIPEMPEVGNLELTPSAQKAMTLLYGLYLVGEPAIAIARLARAIGDWAEPLGQGRLGALAMLERTRGTVALAPAVSDWLDGAPPREIRIAGGPPGVPRAGAWRVARDGRPEAEVEAHLIDALGRIAIVSGALAPALLEARLHGATAVSMLPPGERPHPWPDGAGLVLVLYGTASAWVADLPKL